MKTVKSFMLRKGKGSHESDEGDGEGEHAGADKDEKDTRHPAIACLVALVENKYFGGIMTIMTIYALFGDGE